MERTSLLLRIDEEFERAGVVVVAAPAGFGKTSLLEDVGRRWRALRGKGAVVVRVDCSQRRCVSFMDAYRLRRARGDARPPRTRPGADPAPPGLAGACVPGEPVSQLLWACVDERAPEWADALRCRSSVSPGAPLVVVDNLPAFDGEEDRSRFGDTLRRWVAAGARFIVACVPSRDVSNEFPDALRLSALDLRVGQGEMVLWARELHLPDSATVLAATAGVPALVDACRSAMPGSPLAESAEVCRRSARIIASVLSEPATLAVERLETAMLLLGEGTVGELGDMGVELRPDDLAIVANEYPLFGLDLMRGSFKVVPMDMASAQGVYMDAALRDAALAGACVGKLVRRGDVTRAVALLRLLPDDALAEALGCNAMPLLDAAVDDVVARGLRHIADGGVCSPRATRGLAQLDVVRRDVRGCPLVWSSSAELAGPPETWSDVRDAAWALAHSWEALGPRGLRGDDDESPGDDAAGAETGGSQAEQAGAEPDAGEARRAAADGAGTPGEPVPDGAAGLRELCVRLARAAADCDPRAASRARDRLLVRLGDVSLLSARLLCHHAALCTILALDPDGALAWLAGTSSITLATRVVDSPNARPQTISEALLLADACAARVLMECPSASAGTQGQLAHLRACREFLEQRRITSASPLVGVMEALCCLLDGREMEAASAVEAAMPAFRSSGCLYGQLLCTVVRAYSELARGQAGQAAVSAASARKVATAVRSRPLVELAGLLETLALWPRRSLAGLDARLLEVTLRESALRPRSSEALVMERALLCCASGDSDGAREALDEACELGGAVRMRILCVVVRASGNLRSRMTELAAPSARVELAALARADAQPTPAGRPRPTAIPPVPLEKPLVIRMFGGMSVEMHGRPLGMEQWGRTKSRQLLGVLAMQADKPLQREHIMAALWPGKDPNTLRSSLYSALTTLRGVLGQKNGGPQLVESAGSVVRLNLELVEVDVLRLETMARDILSRRDQVPDGELFAACSEMDRAYQSGLDPEFDNLGDEGVRRSETLASLFAETMAYGSRRAMASDPSLALWFARCAQRACGHREDVTLAIMRSLRALSRLSAALGEYRSFADFERETFGMQPAVELRRERDSIISELAVSGSVAIPPEMLADGAACMAHMECAEEDARGGYALYRQRE